ncbi:MAG: TonB-dependent receptor [Sphingomonadales bacterium]
MSLQLQNLRGRASALAVAAAAGFAALPALAQAPGAGAPLDEILVTATRTQKPITAIPNTIRVLDRDSLAEQLVISSSILDGLSFYVPSFSPSRQKLSGFGESFRGRSPLYLIDGVPQSNPLRDGSRDGFTVDPEFIERVEVIYGANAIQGVGATGGIINYVTPAASKDGLAARLSVTGTSHDGFDDDGFGYKLAGLISHKIGAFDFVVGGSFESRGLFFDAQGRGIGTDNTQGDIQDSDAYNLFAKLGVDLSPAQRLELMVNGFDLKADNDFVPVAGDPAQNLPTTAAPGATPGDPAQNEVRTLSLTYRHEALAGGSLTAQGFFQDFEAVFGGGTFGVFQDPSIAPAGTLFDQSANNSEKYGFKLVYVRDDVAIDGLQVAAGLDYLRDKTFQALVQTDRLWVPEAIFASWAPFLQLEQALLDDRLRLSGGVRVELAKLKVDDFTTLASSGSTFVAGGSPSFDEPLFNAGLVFEPVADLSLFASFSEGFTMPDVGRVLRAISVPGQNVADFLNLKPILADNIEVGFTWNYESVTVQASYFWSSSALGQRLLADADGIFSVQREKTKINGFEAQVTWQATDKLRLGANFAALNGRFDGDGDGATESQLAGVNISPDRLNLFVEGAIGHGFSGRLQAARLFDRDFGNASANDDFNGYSLIDATLSWDGGEAGTVTLAAENLLDNNYITYFSQTTRRNSPLGFFAGRGRTLSLRYQYSF